MKLLVLFLSISFISYAQINNDHVKNEIIVNFKSDIIKEKTGNNRFKISSLSEISNKLSGCTYKTIVNKKSDNTVLVTYNSTLFSILDVIKMYNNTGFFNYVEPNYIASGSGEMNTIPNDSGYGNQWSLKNNGTFPNSTSGADIDMELAWDIEIGDPNMIVAIIDTGLRINHPEFSNRIWTNTNEVADGTDTDGNGFIDDLVAGWDFINSDNNPTDDHGHGTNVAGIAVATGNNTIGYAGVNWNSKIMICKALNQNNSGSYTAIAGSIYYAVDNGAKIINMSIGGSVNSTTLSNAVDYCYNNGVVLVACMTNFNNNVNYYPAAYNKTIAVGATNPDDTRSNPFFWSATSGSNFGNHIDVVAPGNYMYGLSHNSDTNYNSYWGGTSQASPLVAGVVSLLFAQNPNLTFEEIRTILRESAEDQVGDIIEDTVGFDIYYGYGRLNAYNALTHQILSTKGVDKIENNIILYPNPLLEKNLLTISNLKEGTYTFDIFSIVGQKVFHIKKTNTNLNQSISLPKLRGGTYILKISNELNTAFFTEKIVLK